MNGMWVLSLCEENAGPRPSCLITVVRPVGRNIVKQRSHCSKISNVTVWGRGTVVQSLMVPHLCVARVEAWLNQILDSCFLIRREHPEKHCDKLVASRFTLKTHNYANRKHRKWEFSAYSCSVHWTFSSKGKRLALDLLEYQKIYYTVHGPL